MANKKKDGDKGCKSDEEAALQLSPFSRGAASWGVVGLSDNLQAMGSRVVPSAAHEDHALADTLRSPATVLLHSGAGSL